MTETLAGRVRAPRWPDGLGLYDDLTVTEDPQFFREVYVGSRRSDSGPAVRGGVLLGTARGRDEAR